MKTLKLLGIVLLSALFVLGMTACPEDPVEAEPEEIEGIVQIKVSDYGPYSGKELVASFNMLAEYDDVQWEWFKIVGTVESSLANLTGGKTNKFTPADENFVDATYAVQVTATGYEGSVRASVAIKKAPAYIDFFGTWKSDKFVPSGYSGGAADHEEIVVISDTKFRLDSTWDGKSTKLDDNTGDKEYLEFTIVKWDALTGNDLSVNNTTYAKGFKLSVDTAATKTEGYGSASYEAFNLYLLVEEAGSTAIRIQRSGESNKGGTLAFVERAYTRQ